MEAILLGDLCVFVWLIFTAEVAAGTSHRSHRSRHTDCRPDNNGAHAQCGRTSSSRLRIYKYTVPIVSQVRGLCSRYRRKGNRPVKKGRRAFPHRPDAVPVLEGQQPQWRSWRAQASQRELGETQKGANAKIVEARAAIAQATSKIGEATARRSSRANVSTRIASWLPQGRATASISSRRKRA